MLPSVSPPPNILLVGFMGTGKSSIGRELSHLLGYEVIDTDSLIVKNDGREIKTIFAEEGEKSFRLKETEALKSLRKESRKIISTGGGIIHSEENRALIRSLGYVVWLVASPHEIHRRTSRNGERPLLNNDHPEKTIQDLLTQRHSFYEEVSDLTIDTEGFDFQEISIGILESARYYFSQIRQSLDS